jgi:para-aminobenzoate synthetase component 1
MEKVQEFRLPLKEIDLQKLTAFAEDYTYASILTSNNYPDPYGKYECMAAFGAYRILQTEQDSFSQLKLFIEQRKSWLFGHFSYELKNETEDLDSQHIKAHEFSQLCFFEPAYLLLQEKGSNWVSAYVNEEVKPKPFIKLLESLKQNTVPKVIDFDFPKLHPKMTKEEYIGAFDQLMAEIQYGNIYEVNYCQQFNAEVKDFNPYWAFLQLNQRSPMPFAAFYKNESAFAISASPERFICKRENKLYSQPIKGTAKRGKSLEEDENIKKQLRNDLKEQTENVMIVDLVRNDLSRTAAKASVKVEELFGVYTFPQVHQLISTVSSELSTRFHFIDAIEKAFPMGSMTGAPKVSAMKIVDRDEKSRRELYSGSIGYIDPEGNFDFNVVIRTLLYNAKSHFLSLTVGGAITAAAEAEKEYEECLLKAKAIFDQQKQA